MVESVDKMLKSSEILESLQNCPQGFLKPDHNLFSESNSKLLRSYKKLGTISNREDKDFDDSLCNFKQIFCNEFGCSAVFDNISSYQSHYNVKHRFICAECKKSLPTDHLLDLHISEQHDSYFKARIERGEILLKCYLEECKEKFGNSNERKEHCIKQHKLPSNFRFEQSGYKRNKHDTFEKKSDTEIVCRGLKTISFGHPKEKTFGTREERKEKRETNKTLEDMKTLKQALESM